MTQDRFGGDALDVQTIQARLGGHEVVAGIQPNCGANLVSLQVDGQEYIHYDERRLREKQEFTGCFIMFPTPCRVPDGRYEFQGRTIVQNKSGRLYTIHGLVRDEPLEAQVSPDRVEAKLTIAPGEPIYEGFPFPGELRVSMQIVERGLEYGFCFENRGPAPAPVGFGLHPYWRISGRRCDTFLCVPCEKMMVLKDLVPAGGTAPVGGTALDLRNGRCLEGFTCDNVFLDRMGPAPAWIEHRDIGKRMTLRADAVFTHQIAYAPAGEPFVCLENLTCAPNAVNLQSIPREVSGLRIVPPGGKLAGTTRFVVEDI